MLEQEDGRHRVVRDVAEHIPLLGIPEHVDALCGRYRGSRARAGFKSLFPLDPEPDQRAHGAPDLDRLVTREVAEMLHLELPARVLVNDERIDHAHGARVMEAFEV